MRVTVLASGSRGNACLVQAGGTRLLIDAGIAPAAVRERLQAALGPEAEEAERLDAIVITHSHGDHVAKLEPVARSFGAPIHLMEATERAIRLPEDLPTRRMQPSRPFRIGAIEIRPLLVPHDAPQVALVFAHEGRSAALVTDLGAPTAALIRHLEGVDLLLLESNHEPSLLELGPYPPFLKRRIASRFGHLSNRQASEILERLGESSAGPPAEVVLMHLSEKCNTPELALRRAKRALPSGVPVCAAEQDRPLDRQVRERPRGRPFEQLALPW